MSTAPELLEIRTLAREFASAELRPHVETWDAHGGFDESLTTQLAELGFLGMLVPEDAGGMGFDLLTCTAAIEELAWGEAGAALLVAQTAIATDLLARHGSAVLREAWLSRLAAGAATVCFVDDAPVRMQDERISGSVRHVVNGARAQLALVSTRWGAYAVDRDGAFVSAVTVAPLGLRTLGVADLSFDGPAVALGVQSTETTAALLCAAAVAVGIAQAALEHATRYADVREQFDRPIRTFEGIQFKLADMATRVAAARALVQRAATDPGNGAAAAMAKLSAATCAMAVTTEAVQVFGGYGYMRDYPVEKLMRDAKALELLHGTNEQQRLRVAESLYA